MDKNLNEQLGKSKILMGYDLKKTAIENKKMVEEQAATNASPVPPRAPLKSAGTTPVPPTGISPSTTPAPAPAVKPAAAQSNILTDEDLMGNTNLIRSYLQTISDFSLGGLISNALGGSPANLLAGRRTGVKGVVDALDGWVDVKDLAYVLSTVTSLKGKQYLDDTQEPPVKIPAMQRFVELYLEDEGEDLIADVQGVGTKTLPAGTEKIKTKIVNMINSLLGQSTSSVTDTGTPAPGQTGSGGYKPCTEFPFSYGCANQAIGEIQKCLGLVADGKFGNKTSQALISKGFDGKTITKEIYDTIKTKMCGGTSSGDTRLTQLIRLVQKDGNISYVKNKLSVEDNKILTDYLGKSGYVPSNDPVLVKKYMAYQVWTNPNISQTVDKVKGLPNQPVATNAPNAPTRIKINESQLKNLIAGISSEQSKKTKKK